MAVSEIKDALATAASICTIIQFFAGVLVCRKFIKNGTTGDTPGLAFVTCYMSCSLWLRYGLLVGDSFVVLVNIFGTVLQLLYVIVFILYTVKKSITIKQLAAATSFVALVYFYSILQSNHDLAIKHVGLISCGVTTMFFASPLINLAHVIKVKSAESLPFPVIISSFVVSCQWFAYGCLIGDTFIQMPNFLGCLLSAFQLSLFVLYPAKRSDQYLI